MMLSYDSFVDDVVEDEIQNILNFVDIEISLQYVKEIDIPIASELIMTKLRKLVNLAIYPHDGKVTSMGLQAALEVCEANSEPAPISIDPWARGIVPLKKVGPLPLDHLYCSSPHSKSSTPRSMSSVASASTTASSTGSLTGRLTKKFSSKSFTPATTLATKAVVDQTGKIYSIDDEFEQSLKNNNDLDPSIRKLRNAKLAKKATTSISTIEDKDTVMKSVSITVPEVIDKNRVKDISKTQKLTSRNPPQQVVTEKPLSSTLPARVMNPIKVIKPITINTEHNNVYLHSKRDKSIITTKEQKKTSYSDNITKMNDVQVAAVNANISKPTSTIKLQAPIPLNPIHDSKHTHVDQPHTSHNPVISKASNKTLVAANPALMKQPSMPAARQPMKNTSTSIDASLKMKQRPTIDARASIISDRMKNESIMSSMLGDDSFNDSSILLPASMPPHIQLYDMDTFEGKRTMLSEPADHPAMQSYEYDAEESTIGPKNTAGRISPSIPPVKPSQKQLEEARRMFSGGLRPKDRDFLGNMKLTSDRKKLPPPPLGMITGHGAAPTSKDAVEHNMSISFPLGSTSMTERSIATRNTEHSIKSNNGIIRIKRSIVL